MRGSAPPSAGDAAAGRGGEGTEADNGARAGGGP